MPSYTATIARSVRAYGTCTVEANTPEEAMEKLRASAESQNPRHNEDYWANAYDVEWETACEESILDLSDDETDETVADTVDLTPPNDPCKIMPAEELAQLLAAE